MTGPGHRVGTYSASPVGMENILICYDLACVPRDHEAHRKCLFVEIRNATKHRISLDSPVLFWIEKNQACIDLE